MSGLDSASGRLHRRSTREAFCTAGNTETCYSWFLLISLCIIDTSVKSRNPEFRHQYILGAFAVFYEENAPVFLYFHSGRVDWHVEAFWALSDGFWGALSLFLGVTLPVYGGSGVS